MITAELTGCFFRRQAAYPPAGQPYVQPPPMQATYVQPAPPPGYPGSYNGGMMNPPPLQVVAPQTQSRGDKTFWEGW